jgi:hypothetical protein
MSPNPHTISTSAKSRIPDLKTKTPSPNPHPKLQTVAPLGVSMSSTASFDVKNYFKEKLPVVETALDDSLKVLKRDWEYDSQAETCHEAMRYSLMAGGKRIRPILCIAAR